MGDEEKRCERRCQNPFSLPRKPLLLFLMGFSPSFLPFSLQVVAAIESIQYFELIPAQLFLVALIISLIPLHELCCIYTCHSGNHCIIGSDTGLHCSLSTTFRCSGVDVQTPTDFLQHEGRADGHHHINTMQPAAFQPAVKVRISWLPTVGLSWSNLF